MNRPFTLLPLLALAGVIAAGAARAQGEAQAATRDSRLQEAFGSTIVSTYPDGRQAELWLKPDGSYTAEGRRHDRSSGAWRIKQDGAAPKLCLKQHHPFPAPFTYCTGVPSGSLDQPWTGKAWSGEPISIRLVRGVYDPAAKTGGSGAQASSRSNDQG